MLARECRQQGVGFFGETAKSQITLRRRADERPDALVTGFDVLESSTERCTSTALKKQSGAALGPLSLGFPRKFAALQLSIVNLTPCLLLSMNDRQLDRTGAARRVPDPLTSMIFTTQSASLPLVEANSCAMGSPARSDTPGALAAPFGIRMMVFSFTPSRGLLEGDLPGLARATDQGLTEKNRVTVSALRCPLRPSGQANVTAEGIMFKIIVITAVVLIAAVLIFAATRPDTFRVQRTADIKAPPEKIFALINDFQYWGSWSPYEKKDPTMKRTRSGAASGEGAVYEWEGNGEVGMGRMEITDTSPPSQVTIKLDFIKPFENHNVAEFTLQPTGDTTSVTWVVYGPNLYISKLMGVFFSMDNMIGKDFEAGLADLKAVAEK